MATLWITYSWQDNREDVDFVSQELEALGLTVRLDRWTISAGHRLWEQIESFVQDPERTDAWMLYATQASLGSEACKEEYAYALDRALRTRGGTFPLLALFPAREDSALIPAGIRTRLHVSLTDPDWKERIVAAVEGRDAAITRPEIRPYHIAIHPIENSPRGWRYAIEVRPRAGVWAPFVAAVPLGEKERVEPFLRRGPAGKIPGPGMLSGIGEGPTVGREWWSCRAGPEATPTQSYFVFCTALPSKLLFGVSNGSPQFEEVLADEH
jgi:hypothetical protein